MGHVVLVCQYDVSFRIYAVSSAEIAKKWSKFDVFCPPNLWDGPKNSKGICKSTPRPTYWPGLVEIPWLVFHLC